MGIGTKKIKWVGKTIADLSSAFYSLAIADVGISLMSDMFGRDEFTEIVREKIEMDKKHINMKEVKNGTHIKGS